MSRNKRAQLAERVKAMEEALALLPHDSPERQELQEELSFWQAELAARTEQAERGRFVPNTGVNFNPINLLEQQVDFAKSLLMARIGSDSAESRQQITELLTEKLAQISQAAKKLNKIRTAEGLDPWHNPLEEVSTYLAEYLAEQSARTPEQIEAEEEENDLEPY